MQFICPYCEQLLTIDDRHLGKRGRCNRCGGRIALIGKPRVDRPLRATAVDPPEGPAREEEPRATPAQQAYLKDLGMRAEEAARLSRAHAETQIAERVAKRREEEPPTEKQMSYLQRLGLGPKRLAAVTTRTEADRLIQDLLPPPTENQLAYLRRLGANQAQILGIRTRAEASELIEMLLRGGGGGGKA